MSASPVFVGPDGLGVDDDLLDVLVPLDIPGSWFSTIDTRESVEMQLVEFDALEDEVAFRLTVDGPEDDRMWHISTTSGVAIGDAIGEDHVERTSFDEEYPDLAGSGSLVNATSVQTARDGLKESARMLVREGRLRATRSLLEDDDGELPTGIGPSRVETLADALAKPSDLRVASESYLVSIDGIGFDVAETIVDVVHQEGQI